MVDTSDDVKGINTRHQNQQMTSATQLSSEEMIAWQSQILEMAANQMARLQNLLTVQALVLQGDIEETYIKCQEDPTMLPLSLVNKEKPWFTQDQVLSRVGPQNDSQLYLEKNMTETQEEAMKRQVVEAWKNMKAKKDGINEAIGIQEPCDCCRYYGLWFTMSSEQVKRRKGRSTPGSTD